MNTMSHQNAKDNITLCPTCEKYTTLTSKIAVSVIIPYLE